MIQSWRVVWKCASIIPGAQFAMTSGMTDMHVWSADSWDCLPLVSDN